MRVGSSVRPHAVSSVSGKVNGANNPTYTYDANGNLTSGGGRSIAWTVFSMVECVANGATSCAGGATTKVEYTYDADHSRITQKETVSSTVTTTTYLNDPASGLSSEKTVTGSVTTWTDYLMAGGNRVGARSNVVGVGVTTRYYITDHLGSVAVVTDGTTHARRSYDAWGKSRNTNGTDDPAGAIDLGHGAPTRGFTDHEHVPSVGLVNMNARVYDPELGRFLSADSYVHSMLMSQTLNRFSYCGNNPASCVDPSGHFGFFEVLGLISGIVSLFSHNDIIHTIAGIALGWAFGPGPWLSGLPEIARGFIGGFIVGGVTGHDIKSALFGGLQAIGFAAAGGIKAAFGWADGSIGAILAHGLVGGLVTDARGGKFGAGFLSAGVGEAASPYINTGSIGFNAVAHALVGGIASELGGGKFSNGAITAAFGYLYNREASAHTQLSEAELQARFDRALARCGSRCDGVDFLFVPKYVACLDGECSVKNMRAFGTKAELRAFLDSDEGDGYEEIGGLSRVGGGKSTIYASAVDPLGGPYVTVAYWPNPNSGLPRYKNISGQPDFTLFVLLHEYAHASRTLRIADEGDASAYAAQNCNCGTDQPE